MKIKAIAFTQKGYALGERIKECLEEKHQFDLFHTKETTGAFAWTKEHFHQSDALVYLGAVGIAVRSIAPLIESKTTDPGVLVVDEGGKFVIPLLSGHLGGANALANELAAAIGGISVMTTATDQRGVFAVDSWGKSQELYIVNPERIVEISSALLSGKKVGFSATLPYEGELPQGVYGEEISPAFVVSTHLQKGGEKLHLVPQQLTLGVGCRKDTPFERIEELFLEIIQRHGIHPKAFASVASIDLKKGEAGIIAFAKKHQLPFRTYSGEDLAKVKGNFSASAFVQKVTGVDNVCERSAVIQGERLLVEKTVGAGVTMAVGERKKTVTFA